MIFLLSVLTAAALTLVASRALTRWPQLLLRRWRTPIPYLAATSGLLALAAPGAPTGHEVTDLAYRAVFASLLVLAAARARRWAWMLAAGATLVGDHASLVALPVAAALGLAVATGSGPRPGRTFGALIGVAIAQGALRLQWAHPAGASAVLAGGVFLVLSISHLSTRGRRTRRRVFLAAGTLLVLGLAAAGLYGAAAWSVRRQVDAGLADARSALSLAGAGQIRASSAALRSGRAELAVVAHRTGAWWTKPAQAVPIVAQNVATVDVAVAQARSVLAHASSLLSSARARDLCMSGGSVNLGLMRALAPQVRSGLAAVNQASATLAGLDSPWLISPLRSRLDRFRSELSKTRSGEATLNAALAEVPGILGGDGPRKWLLVVLDNSELRGGGGFIGDVGSIDTRGGHISLASMENVIDLVAPPGGATITGEAEYMKRYGWLSPGSDFQDDAHSPDFPTDARVLEQVYRQSGGTPVDGVIGIDPFGLASLLELTGPVSVSEWPVPISAANAVPVLLHDQYLRLTGTPRQNFLVDLARAVFSHLTNSVLPGPATLARDLGPAAAGRHIQLYSNDSGEERFFGAIDSSGAMAPVRGDFLELATHNFSLDKGDWYLTRDLNYSVRYDQATGAVNATLRVLIHNSAPTQGEPAYVLGGSVTPPGYDKQWVNIYTPLSLASARSGTAPLSMAGGRELSRHVYSAFLTVPAGGSVTLTMQLYGFLDRSGPYRLTVGYQPAPHPDGLTVSLESAGSSPAGASGPGRGRTWNRSMSRPVLIRAG